jgi:hypothetical protein
MAKQLAKIMPEKRIRARITATKYKGSNPFDVFLSSRVPGNLKFFPVFFNKTIRDSKACS